MRSRSQLLFVWLACLALLGLGRARFRAEDWPQLQRDPQRGGAFYALSLKDGLGEPPETLARFLDVPWMARGDLYYIHKLAETILAYRGLRWHTGEP